MIKRLYSIKPKEEKYFDAREYANEVLEFAINKYPQTSPEVYIERFGDVLRIYFISQFETLADLEKTVAEMMADDEYIAMQMKGAALFVEGSTRVTVLQAL